jgi:hypothetical protein
LLLAGISQKPSLESNIPTQIGPKGTFSKAKEILPFNLEGWDGYWNIFEAHSIHIV